MAEEGKLRYETRWQYWSLVIIIYACLVAMGVSENARSVSFPLMKDFFGVSYDTYGFFSSCISVAYILFCLIASFVAEKISYKYIIWMGYIFILLGCLLTQFANSFFFVGACMFIIWMGLGFFEIGSNATSTIVFVENQGTMMSLLHFFFGIGAIVGPNVARLAIRYMNNSFYSVYICIGVIVLVIFIITLLLPFKLPKSENEQENSKPSLTTIQALKMPSVWLCALTMGVGNVIEASGASWAPFYLLDVLHMDINTDIPNFTTLLYIIFTVSRLVSGPIIDKLGYYRTLYICFGAVLILLLIGFATGKWGVYLFALCGFFYSANWPVFICVIMGYFKKDAPVVTSVVIVLQGVVSLPTSYLLGVMNEHLGNQWAYQMTVVFCALAIVLLTGVYYCQKNYEKKQEKKSTQIEMVDLEKKGEEEKNVEMNIAIQEKDTEVVSVTEEKEKTVDCNENASNVIINPSEKVSQ